MKLLPNKQRVRVLRRVLASTASRPVPAGQRRQPPTVKVDARDAEGQEPRRRPFEGTLEF